MFKVYFSKEFLLPEIHYLIMHWLNKYDLRDDATTALGLEATRCSIDLCDFSSS